MTTQRRGPAPNATRAINTRARVRCAPTVRGVGSARVTPEARDAVRTRIALQRPTAVVVVSA